MSQTQRRNNANDDQQEAGEPWERRDGPDLDARYHFEICRVRPKTLLSSFTGGEVWMWRLLSPSGASVIECGGYAGEKSCREAVSLLREKAASATLTRSSELP